jgi:hypothetical protein
MPPESVMTNLLLAIVEILGNQGIDNSDSFLISCQPKFLNPFVGVWMHGEDIIEL